MKILHTSDWHLGAFLENRRFSRIAEQAAFIDELSGICDDCGIDLIIVAGDVFDAKVPPAEAETLFYDALDKLSKNGERVIAVIAGNHDDPQRLTAANALLSKNGVVVIGLPYAHAADCENERFCIRDLSAGFSVTFKKTGEKAIIAALPYVGDKRLGKLIADGTEFDEQAVRSAYSGKIQEMYKELSALFEPDAVNVAVGHLYAAGGETAFGAERDITRGGAYAVALDALPDADYVALGHLHRGQTAKRGTAFYSGSPLVYSLNEGAAPRRVIVADIDKRTGEKNIRPVYISRVKPVEEREFPSPADALSFLDENKGRDFYVYIIVHSDRPLYKSEIDAIMSAKEDIVSLEIVIDGAENDGTAARPFVRERPPGEEFADFYRETYKTDAPGEILALFAEAAELDEREEL